MRPTAAYTFLQPAFVHFTNGLLEMFQSNCCILIWRSVIMNFHALYITSTLCNKPHWFCCQARSYYCYYYELVSRHVGKFVIFRPDSGLRSVHRLVIDLSGHP